MMYFSDCHTHSSCSPDGENTMSQMVRRAQDIGLQELCITDHVDLLNWETMQRKVHDWTNQMFQFREAGSALSSDLKLRLGAEIGDETQDFAQAAENLKNGPELDFVISSVHRCDARYEWEDLYYTTWDDDERTRDILLGYLREEEKLARQSHCDVLGHLTLPLRYIRQHANKELSFGPYRDQVDQILTIAIQRGIGIELNTDNGRETMPDAAILKRYRALGGEIITLGSDSHRAANLGKGIREGQELLKACGFRAFATFEKRKPVFHDL